MKTLLTDNGNIMTNPDDIITEQGRFYSRLYTSESIDDDCIQNLLDGMSRTLSSSDADYCEREITSDELKNALFNMEMEQKSWAGRHNCRVLPSILV